MSDKFPRFKLELVQEAPNSGRSFEMGFVRYQIKVKSPLPTLRRKGYAKVFEHGKEWKKKQIKQLIDEEMKEMKLARKYLNVGFAQGLRYAQYQRAIRGLR